MENSEGGLSWDNRRSPHSLADLQSNVGPGPGRRAISPGADGLCTVSALTQLEARLIQLSLWDTLGTSPWGGLEVTLWTGLGGSVGGGALGKPRGPGANKRPFLCRALSWRAARGAHGPGWGGVAKVTRAGLATGSGDDTMSGRKRSFTFGAYGG